MYMSNMEIISTLKVNVKYPINLVFKYTLKWQQIFKNIEKMLMFNIVFYITDDQQSNTQIVNWSTV